MLQGWFVWEGDIHVYTDSKCTLEAFGKIETKAKCSDDWHKLHQHIEYLQEQNVQIRLHKVHAHAVEKQIAQEEWLTIGNERADTLAGQGAKLEEQADDNEFADANAWLILKRLHSIAMKWKHSKRVKKEKVITPKIDHLQTLHDLGHQIVKHGNQTSCHKCENKWHKAKNKLIVQQGICPGDMHREPTRLDPDLPRSMVKGSDI
jgi:hypothetical protein